MPMQKMTGDVKTFAYRQALLVNRTVHRRMLQCHPAEGYVLSEIEMLGTLELLSERLQMLRSCSKDDL